VGTAVGSLADAQPGDLIANSMHVGIYAGNGMVVNALKPSVGTAYTPVQYAFSGGYSIRRVM
jgi:cell wall-associated NlpC family hydrolase